MLARSPKTSTAPDFPMPAFLPSLRLRVMQSASAVKRIASACSRNAQSFGSASGASKERVNQAEFSSNSSFFNTTRYWISVGESGVGSEPLQSSSEAMRGRLPAVPSAVFHSRETLVALTAGTEIRTVSPTSVLVGGAHPAEICGWFSGTGPTEMRIPTSSNSRRATPSPPW